MAQLTAKQMVKHLILISNARMGKTEISHSLTSCQIDELYDGAECLRDAESEVRCGDFETETPCDDLRHYEAKSVAAMHPSGQWVGWTYYYGGGKHAEPDGIEWIEDAYFLESKEETRVVRVFNKI